MPRPAANRHPKATPQWLFVGWPACRLPGLKRLRPFKGLNGLKRFNASKAYKGFKPLKPSKTSTSLAASTKPSGHKPQRCSLSFAPAIAFYWRSSLRFARTPFWHPQPRRQRPHQ